MTALFNRLHVLALPLVFFSSLSSAFPITYSYSGETTSFNFVRKDNFQSLPSDPSTPLIRSDGSTIFNGQTFAFGEFTLDRDTLPAPYKCGNRDLSYRLSTEGATYSLQSGQGCTDSVIADQDTIAWHIEGPRLSHSGGIDSSIQNFTFNFSNGEFIGGTFNLQYMITDQLVGGISGVINRLVQVPEPSSIALLAVGIVGIALNRKRPRT